MLNEWMVKSASNTYCAEWLPDTPTPTLIAFSDSLLTPVSLCAVSSVLPATIVLDPE